MITRACISINNRCNLVCGYIIHIHDYIDSGRIHAYTITNGTLGGESELKFLIGHKVDVGFSIDGIPEIHNRWRCGTHDSVMHRIEMYRHITGHYPSLNCTVGADVLMRQDETIGFFLRFNSRITFSRMVGRFGVPLPDFRTFLSKASRSLDVRMSDEHDCVMYGGKCGAGMGSVFYANGKAWLCGNCIDLPPIGESGMPLSELEKPFDMKFDRTYCYKEILQGTADAAGGSEK